MVIKDDIQAALEKMILSASGWRGIFAADGGEESKDDKITDAHIIISASAALVFAEYLMSRPSVISSPRRAFIKPLVLLGTDTRPTGKAVVEAMMPVLSEYGCSALYAGYTAAPEIMAWARTKKTNQDQPRTAGFIYVSASHNPIGHNGLKFGLTDGGVLQAEDAYELIINFKNFLNVDDNIIKIKKILVNAGRIKKLPADENCNTSDTLQENEKNSKAEGFRAYYDFCCGVLNGSESGTESALSVSDAIKNGLVKNPLGIVCDFNGSARAVSIDKEFFKALGFKFECINDRAGEIVHKIVPEGESLEPCRRLLEEARSRDASFALGYVPDCDGDRGNLVVYDDAGKARALEAQEVFALACAAEFSHLVWTGELTYDNMGKPLCRVAVAVNDPTSMRIDRIAGFFGIEVFRAEVGEVNVVSLARKLRENGYIVRILGEGSAGGNITHPSAVRDPVNTVLALAKMLTIRPLNENGQEIKPDGYSSDNRKGFFKIWCELSGQKEKYRGDFSISDIIASLPAFTSTPSYSDDAVMRIKETDHALLKDRYQKIFLEEWERRRNELRETRGILSWEAVAYNGITEKRGLTRFGEAGKGGLKIIFSGCGKKETAYIWMRGSATEPVFRLMADVEGSDVSFERYLLNWQRQMIMKADKGE